ncbi:MAG: hypothetical protein AB1489_05570 [Acidobacteriota bacterium]
MEIANKLNRREPRLRLSLPIVSEWQTQDGLLIRVSTLSNNISYYGLGITLAANVNWSRTGLHLGSRIKLAANNYRYLTTGTVQHISLQPDGSWLIGIKLDSPLFSWLARYKVCSQQLLANFVPLA